MVIAALVALAIPLAAWFGVAWEKTRAVADLKERGEGRLRQLSSHLGNELERFKLTPFLLARDPEVAELLTNPQDLGKRDIMNTKLEELNAVFQTSAIYVMDREGTTLASSNWASPQSFVGENFSYRPYFQDALAVGIGRYFALGSTSGIPGYYIAYPVFSAAGAVGVVVVKVDVQGLELAWRGGGSGVVMLSDSKGVVLLSSSEGWRYRTMEPLSSQSKAELRKSRQYGDQSFDELPFARHETVAPGVERVRMLPSALDAGESVAEFRYLLSMPMPEIGWRLSLLDPGTDVVQRTYTAMSVAVFLSLGLLFAVIVYFERRWASQRAQEELERRVDERTADLVDANRRLEEEIERRQLAETELVQAAKLAALGQMAAGITHEVNQPLSAIRAFADNAKVLIEREMTDQALANLGEIAKLTERMGSITRQLRAFSRKPSEELKPVPLRQIIDGALLILDAPIRKQEVVVMLKGLENDSLVMAEDVRLQQVLVNLFRNALDAMQDAINKRLEISAMVSEDAVVIEVRDSGPGIAAKDMIQLFTPFHTTKPSGEGLGLGLSISEGIIRSFGGSIEAANHPEGGAEFFIRLRRAGAP